jgi:hypothetical protein
LTVFSAFDETSVVRSCSDSTSPKLTSATGTFDTLLPSCVPGVFFAQTGGSTDGCTQASPCATLNAAIAKCTTIYGEIDILGSSFSDGNVSIPAGISLVFSTFGENLGTSGKVNLTYSGSAVAPFFSVTTGEVTFANLTIIITSANKGPFLSLSGFFFFLFVGVKVSVMYCSSFCNDDYFVGAGYVQIADSSILSGGSPGTYAFAVGVTGTLLLRDLLVSLNLTIEAGSFLSAENGLTAIIDNCEFANMTTASAHALILQHETSTAAVSVSIMNSVFSGLVVCFIFCEN